MEERERETGREKKRVEVPVSGHHTQSVSQSPLAPISREEEEEEGVRREGKAKCSSSSDSAVSLAFLIKNIISVFQQKTL